MIDMNNLLWKLRDDPRIERFQGLHIAPNGNCKVVHRFGALPFETIEDALRWTSHRPKPPEGGTPNEEGA